MPNLPYVHLFRRIGLFVSVLVLLSLFVQPAPYVNALAAANTEDSDVSNQEVYTLLKAGKRVWKDKEYVKPEQPTVYLTFDDGPSKLTGRVLDILREEGVLATFFMLGEQAEAYPEQVRRAVKEGHAIGNHTYNHEYKELYNSVESFWQQIEQTEEALDEAAGIRPRLIRAPGGTYGNFDAFYFYYLDQAGYEVHDWNVDSGDAKRVGVPASEIVQTVKRGPFEDEVIVLMHDGTGHEQTVKALPDIIRLFKAKGYAFAALRPSVQPVHFSAGKGKWMRSVGAALHNRLIAEAGRHKLSLEEARGQQEQKLVLEEDGQQTVKEQVWSERDREAYHNKNESGGRRTAPAEPLEIVLGSGKLLIEPGQYRLAEGHYQVPLRKLIEAMGGQAEWRESQRTAVAHYEFREINYDFARQELRVHEGGRQTTYHLPQMELRDGAVYVPLRETMELLGNRISSYGMENGRMQVEVALTGGFAVPYGF